jgi:UDP-GlcNAc:undecaprenyl-phosphate GlcNAc-1-phosphate transferase
LSPENNAPRVVPSLARRAAAALALAGLILPPLRGWAETTTPLYAMYLLVCSFLLCYLLVPLAASMGLRLGILDMPDRIRKKHSAPTPLTGGAAIYVAFCSIILLNFHFSLEMKAVLVAGTIIFVVGLLDDWRPLSARVRLMAQVGASLLVILFGVRITFIPPWLGGVYVETLITLVWLVGITNSMNFVDGMDGLAAGTSIIYAGFFALTAILTNQTYMMFLAVAIAGSCMGFFPFNFRKGKPALIFLGDAGSTFLGFLLASFAILGEWGENILDIAVPILIMSVLIFDMTLTTVVRIAKGEVKSFSQWLHYAGRDHFHHRLADLGISQRSAAWLFFSVSFCFGVEALAMLFSDVLTSTIILAHSILAFVIVGIILVVKGRGTDAAPQAIGPEQERNVCVTEQDHWAKQLP